MAVGWWNKTRGAKDEVAPATANAGTRQLCYIEFAVDNAESLARLISIVEAFKHDKTAAKRRPIDGWAALFTSQELHTFWSPDEKEMANWNHYWFSTPLPKRHSADMPSPPWHFESMLDAILENGEYDLVGVRTLNDGAAVLEFDPHAYPYGGTSALRALVRAFGHRVIGMDDGTGYAPGDPEPPRWTPDMTVDG